VTAIVLMMAGLTAQFSVIFFRNSRLFRGRLFTRPLCRRVRFLREPFVARCVQWAVVLGVSMAVPGVVGDACFWVPWTVFHLDDWFTGGDDDWRRRWESVRNRVRWLMQLPAPTPVGGTA